MIYDGVCERQEVTWNDLVSNSMYISNTKLPLPATTRITKEDNFAICEDCNVCELKLGAGNIENTVFWVGVGHVYVPFSCSIMLKRIKKHYY